MTTLLWGGEKGEVPGGAKKLATATLVLWGIAFMICLYPAAIFETVTNVNMQPPHGSASAKAEQVMLTLFPKVAAAERQAIIVRSVGKIDVGPDNPVIRRWSQRTAEAILQNKDAQALGVEVLSYYNASGNSWIVDELLSPDRSSMVMTVLFDRTDGIDEGTHFSKSLEFLSNLDRDELPRDLYEVALSGRQQMLKNAKEGLQWKVKVLDVRTIPLVFLVLTLFLQRPFLLAITGVTMLTSLVVSFAIGTAASNYMDVLALVPCFMEAVIVAFSTDYNLFLMCRFLEMKDRGIPTFTNVKTVLFVTASETVLISGLLIALAMFSLALIDVQPMQAYGIMAGIGMLVTVAVNCTLLPAALLLCGDLLAEQPLPKLPASCSWRACGWLRPKSGRLLEAEEPMLPTYEVAENPSKGQTCMKLRLTCASLCDRTIAFNSRKPLTMVVLLFVSMAVFFVHAPQSVSKTSPDPVEWLPLDAPAVQGLNAMQGKFAPGLGDPFSLVLFAKQTTKTSLGQGCFSPEGYDAMRKALGRLALDPSLKAAGDHLFLGPTAVPVNVTRFQERFPEAKLACSAGNTLAGIFDMGSICDAVDKLAGGQINDIGYLEAVNLLNLVIPEPGSLDPLGFGLMDAPLIHSTTELLRLARDAQDAYKNFVIAKQLSQDGRHAAMFTSILVPCEPEGLEGSSWIIRAQAAIRKLNSEPDFDGKFHLTLTHPQALILHDYSDIVTDILPVMLTALVIGSCIVVVLTFKSLPVAFVMLVSILYAVVLMLGAAYFAFQTSAIYWLFPWLSKFRNAGLSWAALPLCAVLAIALAMDYVVFILSQVYEFRKEDFTTQAAVKKALKAVGPTIACAAVIMIIIFSNLMLLGDPVLTQMGLCLSVAVAADAFLVAFLLVPAIVFALDRYMWWPASLWRVDGRYDETGSESQVLTKAAAISDDGVLGQATFKKRSTPLIIGCVLAVVTLVFLTLFFSSNLDLLPPSVWLGGGIVINQVASSVNFDHSLPLPGSMVSGNIDLYVHNPNWLGGTVFDSEAELGYRPDQKLLFGASLVPSEFIGQAFLHHPVYIPARATAKARLTFTLTDGAMSPSLLSSLAMECNQVSGTGKLTLQIKLKKLKLEILGGIAVDLDGVYDQDAKIPCVLHA